MPMIEHSTAFPEEVGVYGGPFNNYRPDRLYVSGEEADRGVDEGWEFSQSSESQDGITGQG